MGSAGKTRSSSSVSRLLRRGSEMAGRAVRAFPRLGDRPEERRYELGEALAIELREEAERRGATEREVLEEAVRLYLAGRGT